MEQRTVVFATSTANAFAQNPTDNQFITNKSTSITNIIDSI